MLVIQSNVMPIYARIKAVKDVLTEQGSITNEQMLMECADQAGAEMENQFIFLIDDLPNFDLQSIEALNPTDPNKSNLDWFVKLNNQLTELMFWQKSNPTPDNKAKVDKFTDDKIPGVIESRFRNFPFQHK